MAFRLWLRKTTYQRLLQLQRYHQAARRNVDREVGLPDGSSFALVQRLLAGGSTPSQQFEQAEKARRIREALAHLSDADREVLLMRTLEGLTNQEVAEVLEIEPVAASQRYGRALVRLRAVLVKTGLLEAQP